MSKRRKLLSVAVCFFVVSISAICFLSAPNTFINENYEALADGESSIKETCTSPKTWLGLGSCMNVTSIMCKDNSGDCD